MPPWLPLRHIWTRPNDCLLTCRYLSRFRHLDVRCPSIYHWPRIVYLLFFQRQRFNVVLHVHNHLLVLLHHFTHLVLPLLHSLLQSHDLAISLLDLALTKTHLNVRTRMSHLDAVLFLSHLRKEQYQDLQIQHRIATNAYVRHQFKQSLNISVSFCLAGQ